MTVLLRLANVLAEVRLSFSVTYFAISWSCFTN